MSDESMKSLAPMLDAITIDADKPPMPAHDYARQWASDTLSGRENGVPFEWGERNLARSYQNLRRIIIVILEADERGQGTPFAEAMDAAAKAVGRERP